MKSSLNFAGIIEVALGYKIYDLKCYEDFLGHR